jgi:hypothetical protein
MSDEANDPNVLIVEKQSTSGKKILVLGAAGVALLAAMGAMQRNTSAIATNTAPVTPAEQIQVRIDDSGLLEALAASKAVLDRLAWEMFVEGASPNTGSMAEAVGLSNFARDAILDDIKDNTGTAGGLYAMLQAVSDKDGLIYDEMQDVNTTLVAIASKLDDILQELQSGDIAADVEDILGGTSTHRTLSDLYDLLDQIEQNTSP